MKWDHHLFLGMLFGSILGIFFAAELTAYLPLLVLLGGLYLLSMFLHTHK